jgi:hypothetical protein
MEKKVLVTLKQLNNATWSSIYNLGIAQIDKVIGSSRGTVTIEGATELDIHFVVDQIRAVKNVEKVQMSPYTFDDARYFAGQELLKEHLTIQSLDNEDVERNQLLTTESGAARFYIMTLTASDGTHRMYEVYDTGVVESHLPE